MELLDDLIMAVLGKAPATTTHAEFRDGALVLDRSDGASLEFRFDDEGRSK